MMSASVSPSPRVMIYDAQWPEYDGYQGLDSTRHEIRLLSVSLDSATSTLNGKLRHVSLDDHPDYSTLSYYWGAPVPISKLKRISIGGKGVLIRPTLRSFLFNLVSLVGPIEVWLDALCINQRDVSERNEQVSMMGTIYRSAKSNYAWLGDGTADSDYLCDHLLHQDSEHHMQQTLSMYMQAVLQRPFWRRTWIIQEFAVSRCVTLLIGDMLLDLEIFDQGVEKLVEPDDKQESYYASYQSLRSIRIGHSVDSGIAAMIAMVLQTYLFRCADPRDKIFGILSLVNYPLKVDYTLSVSELVFQVITQWTRSCGEWFLSECKDSLQQDGGPQEPERLFLKLSSQMMLDLNELQVTLCSSSIKTFAKPAFSYSGLKGVYPRNSKRPYHPRPDSWDACCYVMSPDLTKLLGARPCSLRTTGILSRIKIFVRENEIVGVLLDEDVHVENPRDIPYLKDICSFAYDLAMLCKLIHQGIEICEVHENPLTDQIAPTGVYDSIYRMIHIDRIVLALLALFEDPDPGTPFDTYELHHYRRDCLMLHAFLLHSQANNVKMEPSSAYASLDSSATSPKDLWEREEGMKWTAGLTKDHDRPRWMQDLWLLPRPNMVLPKTPPESRRLVFEKTMKDNGFVKCQLLSNNLFEMDWSEWYTIWF